jgi:hypothetical protein
MKKQFFILFLAAVALCALVLTAACEKKETAAERLNKAIEKINSEDTAQEPPSLPGIEQNLFYSFLKNAYRIPSRSKEPSVPSHASPIRKRTITRTVSMRFSSSLTPCCPRLR